MKVIDGEIYISKEEFDRAVKIISNNSMTEALEEIKDIESAMIIGMSGVMFACKLKEALFNAEIK